MLKQRFSNFFHVMFEIESMNSENAIAYLSRLRPGPRWGGLRLSPKPLASFVKQKSA